MIEKEQKHDKSKTNKSGKIDAEEILKWIGIVIIILILLRVFRVI